MKRVLDSIISQCADAILSRTPIIALQTEELELIHRLVESDELVDRVFSLSSTAPYQYRCELSEGGLVPRGKLYGSTAQYHGKIQNVVSYRSIGDFSNAVKRSKDYGTPNDPTLSLDFFPNMYLVHTSHSHEYSATTSAAVMECQGLFDYVDRYIGEKNDNSRIASNCLIIHGDRVSLPAPLMRYAVVIDEPFPERDEIAEVIRGKMVEAGLETLSPAIVTRYANALSGFRLLEVERQIDYFLRCPDENGCSVLYDSDKVMELITQRKIQMLQKDQVLELVSTGEAGDSAANVGGNQNFMHWLDKQLPTIRHAGQFTQETGGESCKGVLVCGVPGCGKSFSARAVSDKTRLPLIKLDIGRLMGKYVGESEHNLAKALRQAEAMSPCILWIDEIEKGFSGASSGSENELSKRMFGSLLTWLQECKKPVFNFATANSIAGLPKEFFRSGRFDELFSLYMPTHAECVDILRKQMQAANKSAARQSGEGKLLFSENDLMPGNVAMLFDQMQSAQAQMRFMTGADIHKLVQMTIRRLWTKADQSITYPLNRKVWLEYMTETLKEMTVYGDGNENLESIAACYIRLLRSNFTPAAENPVFLKEDYCVQETGHKFTVTIKPVPENRKQYYTSYDMALRQTVAEKIESLGVDMEYHARQALIR